MDDLHPRRGLGRLAHVAVKPHPSLLFLKEMLRDPLHVAAVTPSSVRLAELVVAALPRQRDLRVIELGGGTGSFTRAMLAAGVRLENLMVIERSPALHSYLVESFPQLHIARGDAMEIAAIGRATGFDSAPPHAVVSGLPMASMGARVKAAILSGAFELMGPAGVLLQFTYAWKAPISDGLLQKLGLRVRRAGRTLRNMPPATVYVFERDSGRR